MANVKLNTFDPSKIYPEKIRKLQLQRFEERIEKATADVVVSEDKFSAISELRGLITNLKNSLDYLTDRVDYAFQQKQGIAATNDAGNGSDYINVSATFEASKQQINVRVNQVARAASVTVKSINNSTFSTDGEVSEIISGTNPKVTIGFTGTEGGTLDVDLAGDDKLINIVDKINTSIESSNLPFKDTLRASITQDSAGDYFLVIKNSKTGAGEISCTFQDDTTVYITENLNFIDGLDAEIIVDGVTKTSSTNRFTGVVPGVSIEVKKPNDPNNLDKNLIVDIKEDVREIAARIEGFVDAYNKFAAFATTQTQILTKSSGISYGEDAKLYNSAAMKHADSAFASILEQVPGLSGIVSSLKDIGITKEAADSPSNSQSSGKLVTNVSKLAEAIIHRLDEVKKLFQGGGNVTRNSGTGILAYIGIESEKILPRNVVGTPITLDDKGAGHVTFSINGAPAQNALLVLHEGKEYIAFPGTDLEGLKFSYIRTSGESKFTFTVAQGLAARAVAQAGALLQEVDLEAKTISRETDELKAKEEMAKVELQKEQKKIDDLVSKLEFQALQFEEEMDRLDLMIEAVNG